MHRSVEKEHPGMWGSKRWCVWSWDGTFSPLTVGTYRSYCRISLFNQIHTHWSNCISCGKHPSLLFFFLIITHSQCCLEIVGVHKKEIPLNLEEEGLLFYSVQTFHEGITEFYLWIHSTHKENHYLFPDSGDKKEHRKGSASQRFLDRLLPNVQSVRGHFEEGLDCGFISTKQPFIWQLKFPQRGS